MNAVTPLRRTASFLWTPIDGEVVPVGDAEMLRGLITNWQRYGHQASVFSASGSNREARVVSLGGDGWVFYVRDGQMQRWGWPAVRLVSRLAADGNLPTLTTSGQWYSPSDESDLASRAYFAENIFSDPRLVARSTCAWVQDQPLPDDYHLDRSSFEPIPCTSVSEALQRIPPAGSEWTAETSGAASAFAESLSVTRALLMNPRSILVQVASTERRIRFELRKDETVRVVGLADQLGRTYNVSLPSGDVIWRERPRRRQAPRHDGGIVGNKVTALLRAERDADV